MKKCCEKWQGYISFCPYWGDSLASLHHDNVSKHLDENPDPINRPYGKSLTDEEVKEKVEGLKLEGEAMNQRWKRFMEWWREIEPKKGTYDPSVLVNMIAEKIGKLEGKE